MLTDLKMIIIYPAVTMFVVSLPATLLLQIAIMGEAKGRGSQFWVGAAPWAENAGLSPRGQQLRLWYRRVLCASLLSFGVCVLIATLP